METRCFNSVAALALLIGHAGGAFLAPAARAGERIEFSAPAIPLAIPRPVVEVKEPQRTIGSAGLGANMMDDVDMAPPPQVIMTKRKVTRDNGAWDSNPTADDNPDQFNADDALLFGTAANRSTNGGSGLLRRGEASWPGSSPEPYLRSRAGSPNGFDQDNAPQSDRFGRPTASEDAGSFWGTMFKRDATPAGRFNASGFTPFMEQFRRYTGGGGNAWANEPASADDPTHAAAAPPGYGNLSGLDDRQSRQVGEPAGPAPGVMRAWDPPASRPLPPRSSSKPDQFSPSRVVAPERPVILPMPKRPGGPGSAF